MSQPIANTEPSGLRMPAEWEPHAATWIAWPHQREDWPGKFGPIPWVYAEIVRHLHIGERVRILVEDVAAERQAQRVLGKAGIDLRRIDFYQFPTNRSWVRDSGPIFVHAVDGKVGLTAWRFNGWAKYLDCELDCQLPDAIRNVTGLTGWTPAVDGKRVVLEGGSIDVNGHGLMLTTEECLLGPVQARNPDLERADLEEVFAQYLGVRKVLWLDRGIVGDDTHGHVDDIARFVGPRTIIAAVEGNPQDANYEVLQENWRRLQLIKNLVGLDVVALPMPGPVMFGGRRLPASYANFYIANDRVLVPTFNDPNDRKALGILAELFPNRVVVGIHAVDLVWGLGTIHCMTMQEPQPRS